MTLGKIAARAAIAALAAGFLFGAAGSSEAAKEKAAPKDPASFACTLDWMPVCGKVGGKKQTMSNACVARQMGAKQVTKGPCE